MNNHAVDGRGPAPVENGGWFLPPTVWNSKVEQIIWKYLKNWLMDAVTWRIPLNSYFHPRRRDVWSSDPTMELVPICCW